MACDRSLKRTLLLSASALLSACGGGSGGGDAVTASAPVAVTSANASDVAAAGVNAADGLTGSTSGILGVVPAAVGAGHATDVNVVATLIDSVRRAPQAGDSGVHPAAVFNQTDSCDSGSISLRFNDADNDQQLSTGDSVTLSANNCVSSGVSLDGAISMNSLVVSGDPLAPPYSLQFSLQTNGFTVSAGGETVSIRGSGTIAESGSDAVTTTSSFTGSGIEVTASGETLTLTGYQITETHNAATGAYSYAIDATISSSALGGSVQVSTDVALSGVGAFDPDAGQIHCVGAGNSSATLTVVDSVNVQIAVDEDGDGIADNTFSQTWAAL